MLPLANYLELAAYWAAQPRPASRAEWIEWYVSALAERRPCAPLNDAYAAGIEAYKTQAKIHPRLAVSADLAFGTLFVRSQSANS